MKEKLHRIMSSSPLRITATSIIEEGFGEIWLADDTCACLKITEFCLLEGAFDELFGKKVLEKIQDSVTLVSSNEEWRSFFEKQKQFSCRRYKRALYEWGGNQEYLDPYLESIPSGLQIVPISEKETAQINRMAWSDDVFESYGGTEGFLKKGIGFCLLSNHAVVSLCMSYAHSRYGVEIEVDTAPEHQGKGYGKIISAYFIKRCLEQGLKPVWDATNIESRKIAERLGFVPLCEYDAVAVDILF